MVQKLRRIAIVTLALLVGVYAALTVGFYFFQRSLMYATDSTVSQPRVPGADIRVHRISTADGERLVGWYLPPQPGKPVVLFFHGNSGHLQTQVGRFQRMAKAGVGFLAIGYRGYSGSTGSPSEDGLHEDARAAYAWLAERHRPDEIVIHGFSLGTGLAVKLAAEKPARALILEAPFTAMTDLAAARYPWTPIRLLMQDRFLSREYIAKVDMPILIIHGDKDSFIPFKQGETLFGLAHGQKTLVKMIGSDHQTLTRDGLYDHVWTFLGIPATGTAAPGRQAQVRVTHVEQAIDEGVKPLS